VNSNFAHTLSFALFCHKARSLRSLTSIIWSLAHQHAIPIPTNKTGSDSTASQLNSPTTSGMLRKKKNMKPKMLAPPIPLNNIVQRAVYKSSANFSATPSPVVTESYPKLAGVTVSSKLCAFKFIIDVRAVSDLGMHHVKNGKVSYWKMHFEE